MEKELKAFRKLIVWQRAHELTIRVYKATEKFPKHEMFGLMSQMRRAAVSVAANRLKVTRREVKVNLEDILTLHKVH